MGRHCRPREWFDQPFYDAIVCFEQLLSHGRLCLLFLVHGALLITRNHAEKQYVSPAHHEENSRQARNIGGEEDVIFYILVFIFDLLLYYNQGG